ncbi:helix-turn-helix domain-containing protein [Candidatus Symbiopectobacterium sp.]|uniref:helix-turn-helix domain-containing protein n=1 Tax=Candidatus Symbiopectobacterium sp. TaxID=2816440 RepID=UPI0025B873A0|nr:helix-turn-helix domain-containing protein [Candidatus Symbiopectobacterium sp.]
MCEIRLDDEPFTLIEAAAFLKKSQRTVRSLIKAGLLTARKSGPNGKGHYEILKSECLAYYGRASQNQAVNAEIGHQQKGNNRWHSNNVTAIGTATLSSRTVEKELENALTRHTRNKRRNSMIS